MFYNNSSYWVYIYREKWAVLNNLEVYNNSSYGIAFSAATDIITNDLKVYNNGSYALYASSSSVKYYWNIQYFQNAQAAYSNSTSSFTDWSASDYPELWFVDWVLNSGWTLSCDLTTKNNHFVQNVSSTCSERWVTWPTRLDRQPSRYIYWSSQKKQTQPIAYVNWTLTKFDTTGYNYNTNKYLWEVNPVLLVWTISMTNDMRYTETQTVPLILRSSNSSATYTITWDLTTVNGTMWEYSKTQNVTLSAWYWYKHVYVTYTYNWQTVTDHIIIDYINITDSIINKYYGTWSEYIKVWDQYNVCDPAQMTVQTVNPWTNTIPQALAQNTIYILNPGTYIISAYRYFAWNCTAFIGSGDVVIYGSYNPWTATQTSWTLLYSTHKRNIIIDNIKLDWTNNWNGWTHTPIHDWIYFVGASQRYNTINNIQVFNMGSYGLFLNSSVRETLVTNSQFFNNGIDGIYVASSSTYNTFNNIQSFNNKRSWIAWHSYAYSTITNSQFYNNWQYWIYISSNSAQRISDTKVYNNGVAWIYFNWTLNSSYPRYFNNVRIFNNPKATAITWTVNTNRYYGILKVFANDDDTLAWWFVNNNSTMRIYWWNTWVLSNTWEMWCDLVANPRNSEWVFLQTWNNCDTRWYITWWTNTYITWILYGNNQIKQVKPMWLNIGGSIKYYGNETFDYDTTKPVAYAYPIENAAPTVTLSNNGPKNESNTITWTATWSDTEDSASLLKYSFHSGSCNGPVLQAKSSINTYSTMFDEPGQLVVYVVVYDNLWATWCKVSTGVWQNTVPITSITMNINVWWDFECNPLEFIANAIDTWATISYQWYRDPACTAAINGATGQSYIYTLDHEGTYTLYVKATDSQWTGKCSLPATGVWQGAQPSLLPSTLTYGTIVSGTKLLYSNLISSMWATDGDCWSSAMSVTWDITCTYTSVNGGSAVLSWNGIKVTPPANAEWTWTCTVEFVDDEDYGVRGTVIYRYDTQKPVCTWWQPSKQYMKAWETWTITLTCTDGNWVATTSLAGSDITMTTAGLLTLSNATTWWSATARTFTFTYTTVANQNGTVTFTLPNNKVKDIVNNYAGSTWSAIQVVVDTTSPTIVFTWATPANNVWQNRNYFTGQVEVTETNLSGFTWTISGDQTSLYDDSLVLMYNFDNVSALWESSTVVKDMSNYWNNWTISSTSTVVYTWNWKWKWAYNFAWWNINAWHDVSLTATNNFTVSAWIKTNTTSSSNIYFLSRRNSNSKRVWWLIIPSSTRKVWFYGSINGT